VAEFPDVPPSLRSSNPLRLLAFFGPGAIIASVTIGSGETIFASRGGAIFGYPLIWCFVLGAVLKAVQVYSSMRLMTLTGIHPVDYWARMKGPRAWFPWLMIAVSVTIIPSMFSAIPEFLATLLASLYRVDPASLDDTLNTLASLTLIGCALLALRSSYRVLEKSQTVITLLFLVFVIAAFVAFRPDAWALLTGAMSISMPQYPDWVRADYPMIAARPPWVEIMTYVGIVGGNSTDYIAYLSFLRDKRWGLAGPSSGSVPAGRLAEPTEEDIRKGKLWLRAPRTDALVSFALVTLFSIVFLVLGAVILAPARQVPAGAQLLTVQARFLTELHPSLFPFYVVGIVMVFLGTIYGAMELHTRALFECGRVCLPSLATLPLAKVRKGVVAYATVSGLTLIWTGWDPVTLLTPSTLLGGLFACGLWCFSILWIDHRFMPKAFALGIVLKVSLWLSALLLVGFGVSAIYNYVASSFS
jgi:Mn2+/Fe2+ NRAMP family transporter